jgi:hypothetical protein
MLSNRPGTLALGGWLSLLCVIVAVSIARGSHLSTTALLLAVGMAPVVVLLLIAGGAASPTVAEILYAVEKDGRK